MFWEILMLPYRREFGGRIYIEAELQDSLSFSGEIHAFAFVDDEEITSIWITEGLVTDQSGDVVWRKQAFKPGIGSSCTETNIVDYLEKHYKHLIISGIKEENSL